VTVKKFQENRCWRRKSRPKPTQRRQQGLHRYLENEKEPCVFGGWAIEGKRNMRRNPNRDTYKLDENPTEFGKVFIFVRLEAVVSIVMISSLPSSSVARPLLCHVFADATVGVHKERLGRN
jgi:hypothetical protein